MSTHLNNVTSNNDFIPFEKIPRCSLVPINNDDLCNKSYVVGQSNNVFYKFGQVADDVGGAGVGAAPYEYLVPFTGSTIDQSSGDVSASATGLQINTTGRYEIEASLYAGFTPGGSASGYYKYTCYCYLTISPNTALSSALLPYSKIQNKFFRDNSSVEYDMGILQTHHVKFVGDLTSGDILNLNIRGEAAPSPITTLTLYVYPSYSGIFSAKRIA